MLDDRLAASDASQQEVSPGSVHDRIARHMLADGYEQVLDLDKSHGSTLVDARDGS